MRDIRQLTPIVVVVVTPTAPRIGRVIPAVAEVVGIPVQVPPPVMVQVSTAGKGIAPKIGALMICATLTQQPTSRVQDCLAINAEAMLLPVIVTTVKMIPRSSSCI